MKKRIVSVFLCLVMVAAIYFVLPAQVSAETDREAITADVQATEIAPMGLDYTIVDNQVIITNYSGDASVLVIPSVIEGYPVTCVASSAFYNCTGLISLTIPDSVISIGAGAIYGCTSLENITIPFIGGSQMTNSDNCKCPFGYIFGTSSYDGGIATAQYYYDSFGAYLTSTYYIPYSLKNVIVTGGYITNGAFYNCSGLIQITLGNGVSSIASNAFYNCSGLTNITVGSGVNYVESNAFYGCSSLQYNIFDNAKYIGNNENPYYLLVGATDLSISSCKIQMNTKLIAGSAFSDCNNLLGITIPNGLTNIGDHAFYGCSSLSDITLSDGVISIGNYAFYKCISLIDIRIPNSVTSMGYGVFRSCEALSSIVLSDNLVAIENDSFYGCRNLIDFVIPDSVKSIGNYSFYGCESLTSMTIPDRVHNIGESVFSNCINLNCVIIGNGISDIPHRAFSRCRSLNSVTIGKSVTSIGTDAFYWCNLENVHISDIAAWCKIDFNDKPLGAENLYLNGELVTDLVIPAGVYGITQYAFCGCGSLKSITFPESVKNIGDYAFDSCHNLTSVTFNGGISIGYAAFSGCTSINSVYINDITAWCESYFSTIDSAPLNNGANLYLNGSLVTNLVIPKSVSKIAKYAFYGCNSLQSVTISASVTSVGTDTFSYCTGLTYVTFDADITTIPDTMFLNCSGLQSVTLSNKIECIGRAAFSGCSALESITLPNSLTTIMKDAFSGCRKLTNIHLPDRLEYIYDNAFSGCNSLKNIVIPASVCHISRFRDCNSLQGIWVDVDNAYYSSDTRGVLFDKDKTNLLCAPCAIRGTYTVPNGVININSYAFEDCINLTAIVIPDTVAYIGNYVFDRCSNLTDVYYTGTQSQWNGIFIGEYNNYLLYANLTVNYLSACSCVYSDWVVTIQPTLTSEGQRYKTCLLCGDKVTEVIPIPMSSVYRWNISLAGNLKVKFYLQINPSIADNAIIRIYVGENAVTYPVSELEQTPEGLYIAYINVAAAQMTDHIFITVRSGNYISETKSYTIQQYAQTILGDESYSQYHDLVQAMLNYGAAAQLYFDYEAGNLANDGITGTGSAEIPDSAQDMAVSGEANGVNLYGTSLCFQEEISIRYYFRFVGDISAYSFTVNGVAYKPMLKDDLYYIEVTDILPQNIDKAITLTVTDSDGNMLTVSYCPMDYVVRMNEKGSDALKNLVKALYNYHLAAKAL